MKFAVVFIAIVAQVACQGVPFLSNQYQFSPAQLQSIEQAKLQYQQQVQQQLLQQQWAQMQQPQFSAQQQIMQQQRPSIQQQLPTHMTQQQPDQVLQVSNEQLLAIAASKGMDVEAIRQNLLAGRPVEIEIGELNQVSRPQVPQKQELSKSPLNNAQALRATHQHLMDTAPDARVKQMMQGKDFQQWLAKLVQTNPNVVGISNINQK